MTEGLRVRSADEIAPWAAVMPRLRAINTASSANSCAIAAVRHALFAIKEMSITDASPSTFSSRRIRNPEGQVACRRAVLHMVETVRELLGNVWVVVHRTDSPAFVMFCFKTPEDAHVFAERLGGERLPVDRRR